VKVVTDITSMNFEELLNLHMDKITTAISRYI